MRNEIFRRSISLVIVVTIFMVSFTQVYAYAGVGNEEINSYADFAEQYGFKVNCIKNGNLHKEHFEYVSPLGNTGVASKSEMINGDKLIKIEEGELKNTILLKSSGEIYLDGLLVTIEESVINNTNEKTSLSNETSLMPRANRYEIVETCPYGAESDYDDDDSCTIVERNLTWNKPITVLSDLAWVTLFSSAAGIAGGVASAGAGLILGAILGIYRLFDPNMTYASFRDYRYVHETLGFNVTGNMSVARHVYEYFYELNCNNPVSGADAVVYEVFTY